MRRLEQRLGIHLHDGDRVLVLGRPDAWIVAAVEKRGGRVFSCDPDKGSDMAATGSKKRFDCILALDLGRCPQDSLADYLRAFGKPRASLFAWFRDRSTFAPRGVAASAPGVLAIRRKRLARLLGRDFRVLKCTALGSVRTDSSVLGRVAHALFPAAVVVMELTGRG